MNRARVIIGTIISAVFVGLVFPITFWFVARALEPIFGISSDPLTRPMLLILTGMAWTLGLFWIFWAYSYLAYVGGGSPIEIFGVALEPTKTLVTAGPYAYVRNPLVFGMLFILLGVAFLANSLAAILLVPVIGLLAALYLRLFEEPQLEKRFGAAYHHYRRNVPMIIPRPYPYVPQAEKS